MPTPTPAIPLSTRFQVPDTEKNDLFRSPSTSRQLKFASAGRLDRPDDRMESDDSDDASDDVQEKVALDKMKPGNSGAFLISEMDAARFDQRVLNTDKMLAFVNAVDLMVTDEHFVKLFKASGLPRRTTLLIDGMHKQYEWFKTMRTSLAKDLKNSKGVKLQDALRSFMKKFQLQAQEASAFLTTSVLVSEIMAFSGSEHKGTPSHRIAKRAERFWLQYMASQDSELDDSFAQWAIGKDAQVDTSLTMGVLDSPGVCRINPQVNGSVKALVKAALAMVKFIARDAQILPVVSENHILKLVDGFLIRRVENHPMIMKDKDSAEEWMAEFEEKLEVICEAAGQGNRRDLIPTDTMIRANITAALSPALWDIVSKQAVEKETDFSGLPLPVMKSWVLDAQDTLDMMKLNRLKRLPRYGESEAKKSYPASGQQDKSKPKDSDGKVKSERKPSKTDAQKKTVKSDSSVEIDKRETREARARNPCWHFTKGGGCHRGAECHFMHGEEAKQVNVVKVDAVQEVVIPAPRPKEDEEEDFEFDSADDVTAYQQMVKQVLVVRAREEERTDNAEDAIISLDESIGTIYASDSEEEGEEADAVPAISGQNMFAPLRKKLRAKDFEVEVDAGSQGVEILSIPQDHDEWCLRTKPKFDQKTELAKLVNRDPCYGPPQPAKALQRSDRGARNRKYEEHIEPHFIVEQDGARQMLLQDVVESERKAAATDSDLNSEDSIESSSVSEREEAEQMRVAVSGKRLITDWFTRVNPTVGKKSALELSPSKSTFSQHMISVMSDDFECEDEDIEDDDDPLDNKYLIALSQRHLKEAREPAISRFQDPIVDPLEALFGFNKQIATSFGNECLRGVVETFIESDEQDGELIESNCVTDFEQGADNARISGGDRDFC